MCGNCWWIIWSRVSVSLVSGLCTYYAEKPKGQEIRCTDTANTISPWLRWFVPHWLDLPNQMEGFRFFPGQRGTQPESPHQTETDWQQQSISTPQSVQQNTGRSHPPAHSSMSVLQFDTLCRSRSVRCRSGHTPSSLLQNPWILGHLRDRKMSLNFNSISDIEHQMNNSQTLKVKSHPVRCHFIKNIRFCTLYWIFSSNYGNIFLFLKRTMKRSVHRLC